MKRFGSFINVNSLFKISASFVLKKRQYIYEKTKSTLDICHEKKIDTFLYSGIEWRALSYIELNKEQSNKILDIMSALEELDDVQNIFTNANLSKT